MATPKSRTSRRPAASRPRGPSRVTAPVEITTYNSAVRYLLSRVDFERMRVARVNPDDFKLDRMLAFMEAWGNPHREVRIVHVAGTVGKGSTVAMIASILEGCGYTVGQYTSPHLTDMRERIAINGQIISRPDFTELLTQAKEIAESIKLEPTFFEMITAMSFKYFADQAVDLAVVETGLGGRLDSTNIVTPEVSIITEIAMDHEHLLGDTQTKIAAEKAGIIKRGVPVITFKQDPEVLDVIRARAEEAGAPLHVVGETLEFSMRFNAGQGDGPLSRVCLMTETSQFMHLPVPLPGEHQARNCGLALAAIDILKSSGFKCPEVSLLAGLTKTRSPGRMETIWHSPRIIIDGAHNPIAIEALMRSIGGHVPYDSMVCIFGCCEDKNVAGMLKQAARGGDKIIFTKARGNPRAIDPVDLQRQFSEHHGKMCQVAETLSEAIDLASRAVGRDDLICITGSFYLAGEAKKYAVDLQRKREQSRGS